MRQGRRAPRGGAAHVGRQRGARQRCRRRAPARGEAKALSETEAESQLREWCENNGMEFQILTEDDLGIRYK